MLCERGFSTAQSCVIAAAVQRGRGVTAAWEGRHSRVGGGSSLQLCVVGGASLLRGGTGRGVGALGGASLLCKRGISMALERRHCGVRGASALRWSSIIAAATLHGRGVTAA